MASFSQVKLDQAYLAIADRFAAILDLTEKETSVAANWVDGDFEIDAIVKAGPFTFAVDAVVKHLPDKNSRTGYGCQASDHRCYSGTIHTKWSRLAFGDRTIGLGARGGRECAV